VRRRQRSGFPTGLNQSRSFFLRGRHEFRNKKIAAKANSRRRPLEWCEEFLTRKGAWHDAALFLRQEVLTHFLAQVFAAFESKNCDKKEFYLLLFSVLKNFRAHSIYSFCGFDLTPLEIRSAACGALALSCSLTPPRSAAIAQLLLDSSDRMRSLRFCFKQPPGHSFFNEFRNGS